MSSFASIVLLSLPLLAQAFPGPSPGTILTGCATGVHMIVARGTTEIPGTGLAGLTAGNAIALAIPGSDISAVDYPANFDISNSVRQGVSDVQAQAREYAAACPESKIVLMGYSQGAQVVGNAIAGGGTGTPFGTPSPPATPLEKEVQDKSRFAVSLLNCFDTDHLSRCCYPLWRPRAHQHRRPAGGD